VHAHENTLPSYSSWQSGRRFYRVDTETNKRTSLQTSNEEEAMQLIEAKNQAERQPMLNLQITKAYLAGSDSGILELTWQDALTALTNSKRGQNQEREAGRQAALRTVRCMSS
jgi:hypothetical protein